MEWFESGKTHSDYRWSLYLRTGRAYSDSNSAHWRIANEFQNGPGNPGDFVTDTLVNYQGVASVNEWVVLKSKVIVPCKLSILVLKSLQVF